MIKKCTVIFLLVTTLSFLFHIKSYSQSELKQGQRFLVNMQMMYNVANTIVPGFQMTAKLGFLHSQEISFANKINDTSFFKIKTVRIKTTHNDNNDSSFFDTDDKKEQFDEMCKVEFARLNTIVGIEKPLKIFNSEIIDSSISFIMGPDLGVANGMFSIYFFLPKKSIGQKVGYKWQENSIWSNDTSVKIISNYSIKKETENTIEIEAENTIKIDKLVKETSLFSTLETKGLGTFTYKYNRQTGILHKIIGDVESKGVLTNYIENSLNGKKSEYPLKMNFHLDYDVTEY